MCMPAACTRCKHCQSIRETRGVSMCFPVVNIHRSWTIIYHIKRGSWWKLSLYSERSTLLPICVAIWTTPTTTRKPSTWYQGCRQTNPKGLRICRECRKTTTDEPGSTCVHCTCWWEFEGKIGSLLGSGTYLECCGCSIANHQSPSEL